MALKTRTFCLAVCAISGLTLTTPSFAQAPYPDHPVKVIVALPAGGSVDMIARQISQQLTTDLGQPFVVDNCAGGSGQIGMPVVAKAAGTRQNAASGSGQNQQISQSIFAWRRQDQAYRHRYGART